MLRTLFVIGCQSYYLEEATCRVFQSPRNPQNARSSSLTGMILTAVPIESLFSIRNTYLSKGNAQTEDKPFECLKVTTGTCSFEDQVSSNSCNASPAFFYYYKTYWRICSELPQPLILDEVAFISLSLLVSDLRMP